jgi:hypothetical protein
MEGSFLGPSGILRTIRSGLLYLATRLHLRRFEAPFLADVGKGEGCRKGKRGERLYGEGETLYGEEERMYGGMEG